MYNQDFVSPFNAERISQNCKKIFCINIVIKLADITRVLSLILRAIKSYIKMFIPNKGSRYQ